MFVVKQKISTGLTISFFARVIRRRMFATSLYIPVYRYMGTIIYRGSARLQNRKVGLLLDRDTICYPCFFAFALRGENDHTKTDFLLAAGIEHKPRDVIGQHIIEYTTATLD